MYQLNNSLFETDPVLAIECSFKDFEISMREAEYMLEMVEYRNQLNCQRAELKIMMEHGGYEDLGYLYEAADEDKKKSEGGILSAIWNKIKGFFSDIGKAFKNLVSKAEPEKEYPFPKGFNDALNAAMNAADQTKSAIASIGGKISVTTWGIIATAIGAIGVAFTKWKGIKWKEVVEKIKGKVLRNAADKLDEVDSQINETEEPDPKKADEMNAVQNDNGKEKGSVFDLIKKLLSEFASKGKTAFTGLSQAIKNVLSGNKAGDGDGDDDTPDNDDPENNDGKTDDGTPSGTDGGDTNTNKPSKKKNAGGGRKKRVVNKVDTHADDNETQVGDSAYQDVVGDAFTEATENLANLFALIDAL